MRWGRFGVVLLALPLLAVGGLVLAVIVLKGSSNYAESLCLSEATARPGYGAYSMSGELWPPSFECEVEGNGVPTIVVRHPRPAALFFAVAVVVPAWYVVVVGALLWLVVRRPTRPTRFERPACSPTGPAPPPGGDA